MSSHLLLALGVVLRLAQRPLPPVRHVAVALLRTGRRPREALPLSRLLVDEAIPGAALLAPVPGLPLNLPAPRLFELFQI